MAEKKEGTLIPSVLKTAINLSKIEFLNNAEKIPNITPKTIAITIATSAKIAVFGKVSDITELTFFPFF